MDSSTSSSCSTIKSPVSVLLVLLILIWSSLRTCHGFGTFGFDIHHRFSDTVKGILDIDELPEKGSVDYYAAMAHRDRVFRGRGLAGADDTELLAFSGGNETYRLPSLGFLYYANVSLGTPSLSFLVALDTGSDLFWIPCDCTSCIRGLKTRSGDEIDLNIYSPSSSLTSKKVPCNSSMCELQRGCSGTSSQCPYQVLYLSNGTSSSGVLVEDVLHLTAEDSNPQTVDAQVTFGCGQVQTGSFLDGAAPNGLFGLGMVNSSVPSMLASAGLVADSFSMCFGPDAIGRISFGDKGSVNQEETPFNLGHKHPSYNITVTQIGVDKNFTKVEFNAIFDSGTSFTYLNDPAYTHLTEKFNSRILDPRHSSDSNIPFEYCYDVSSDVNDTKIPNLTLTMKGGSQFPVLGPIVFVPNEDGFGGMRYCLGVVKSPNVNIIGQNFMTGHRIVFDRERMVLGWKQSDCYDIDNSNNVAKIPRTVVPPATAVIPGSYNPEAAKNTGGSSTSGVQRSLSIHLIISSLTMLLLPILPIV